MAEIRLVIIRHGETTWNLENRIQGHGDSPLTEAGLRQAESVAGQLAGMNIGQIFSSDLGRAMNTARVIGDHLGIEPIPEPGLRERLLGEFQGLTPREVMEKYPDSEQIFGQWLSDYQIPGGETGRQFYTRCEKTLREIPPKATSDTLAVVTHGGVLDCLFRFTVGLEPSQPRRYSIPNGSLSVIRVRDGEWFIESWGCVTHLKESQPMRVEKTFV